MSAILEFLPEAQSDAEEATQYYEDCLPGLGVRFRQELEVSFKALAQYPLHHRERSGGYRRINLPGFPYYIAYFIRGERIIVAAIGHGSRHPDFWKKRVS